MGLLELNQQQNKIYLDDLNDAEREQNFLFFLGEHPFLFQEFIDGGQLTNRELNYIVSHFHDYTVDPRTFEEDFKRQMRESLPRYNLLKSIELKKDLFKLYDDKYTREIATTRLNEIVKNGNKNTEANTNDNETNKNANRELPMKTTGNNFEQTVNWENGASNIAENQRSNSSQLNQEETQTENGSENENGTTTEKYKREKTPVDTINKIWDYLLKPKAIEYLTQQLSYAFNLIY